VADVLVPDVRAVLRDTVVVPDVRAVLRDTVVVLVDADVLFAALVDVSEAALVFVELLVDVLELVVVGALVMLDQQLLEAAQGDVPAWL